MGASAELPSGVVTFLLTDIEGSTALWDAAPDVMPAVLQRHNALIEKAVVAAGGTLLKEKGEGDSTFCVFARASDAAAAAVEVQAAVADEPWPDSTPIRVRMSLHTGEAVEDERDYFGPTVNRAARIRSVATGGQIVLSEATAALLADRLPAGSALRELGEFALAGLSRPERVLVLGGADDATPSEALTANLPLPGPLAVADTIPLVGRDAELAQLRGAAGSVPFVAIAGEPGVGKTRLATELAREEHGHGTVVLFGRCTEELGVPFQPIAEALDRYVADAPLPDLRAHVDVHGAVLVRLAPSLGRRLGGLVAPAEELDGDAGRARLHEAVTDLLQRAAGAGRVLLVVDDVHWAARPTLQLLRHLAGAIDAARLGIVATYRDTELDRAHPLAAALADLRADGVTERIGVGGLDATGVAAFVDAAAASIAAGELTPTPLAEAVHARTEGNPFFVGQVLRHLFESGQVAQRDGRWELDLADELPEGVREVVGRRLSRLRSPTNQVLTAAAVAGAEFELSVIERLPASVVGDADVLDALDEAVAARVLAEVPGPADRYRFVHALVRETVLAELSSARLARLHRHVAEAIEVVRPTDVTALAHHHAEAARAGDTAKAVDYALRAAAEALVRCSYDEAVVHAERGLQVLDLDDEPASDARVQLLRARVDGLAGGGDADATVQAVLDAAPLARALGDRDAFVSIVSARIPAGVLASVSALTPLAEEAIAWLGDDRHPSSIWLQVRTGLAAVYEGIGHSKLPELRALVERARALDEPESLALCLMTLSMALHGSPNLDEQRAAAREAAAVGWDVDDRFTSACVRLPAIALAAAEGRLTDGFVDLDEAVALLPAAWMKYLATAWRVMEELAAGRFAAAEAQLGLLLDYGGGAPIAMLSWTSDLMWIRHEQGRLDEVLPMLGALDGSVVGADTTIDAAHAWARAEVGDLDGALEIARVLAADDFAAIPQSWVTNATNVWLTGVAATTRDRDLAAGLLPRFDGFDGQILTAAFLFALGAADRCRGVLLDVLGRHDEAVEAFEAALALEDGAPAPPLAARTRYWFARCLLERGADGDAERAAQLLAECRATAEELGMAQLAREAEDLRATRR